MTSTECGLPCLAMVAGALGRRTTLAALRERIEAGRDGVSALALVAAADSLGCAPARRRRPSGWRTSRSPGSRSGRTATSWSCSPSGRGGSTCSTRRAGGGG